MKFVKPNFHLYIQFNCHNFLTSFLMRNAFIIFHLKVFYNSWLENFLLDMLKVREIYRFSYGCWAFSTLLGFDLPLYHLLTVRSLFFTVVDHYLIQFAYVTVINLND